MLNEVSNASKGNVFPSRNLFVSLLLRLRRVGSRKSLKSNVYFDSLFQAAKRAMDAVTEIVKIRRPESDVQKFIIYGASKVNCIRYWCVQ